ncbi:O-antigen ligase family protein [Leptolyngbya sp. DQ-M1]|uniref:O-antigen ligase family protein n=1 Tax=Leptolyngbya sp. DQ-M1 TaxID=2933920 RepID=UPI00329A2858
MNELSFKAKLIAILLACYVHGLTFYFSVSGLVGARTTLLTAIFQVTLVTIPFVLIVLTRAPRQRLFRVSFVELFYLAFVAMFLVDYMTIKDKSTFPENLLIYFGVYWTALCLMRSLTFAQFRLLCPASSAIAVFTSLILLVQVLTGGAQWADNGGRLVAGTSSNPILVAYTGAYAFLSCLVMWLTGRYAGNPLLLVLMVPGFLVSSFAGTRSATLSVLVSAAFVVIYTVNLLMSSNKSAVRAISNFLLYSGVGLASLLMLSPLSAATSSSNAEISPVERALTNGFQRIDILFKLITGSGGGDRSIQGREAMYSGVSSLFFRSPIWGHGLYSYGSVHNAFMQVAIEFGIFGIITFVLPFLYLAFRVMQIALSPAKQCADARQSPSQFVKSDYAMMTCFTVVFLFQSICLFSFHGDPYRNYLPIASVGLMIAFLRFSRRETQAASQSQNFPPLL